MNLEREPDFAQAEPRSRERVGAGERAWLIEALLENIQTGVAYVRGRDLVFEYINAAYQAVAPDKLIQGRSLAEVWPELQPGLEEIFRRVLETGEPYAAKDAKFFLRRSAGGPLEETYFNWLLTRLKAPEEGEWGLLVTFVETTERVRAEQAVIEGARRFRELTEGLPELVWTCLPEGPCDYLSRQWVEYTGLGEAEQLGYGWLEQLHPEDRQKVVSRWKETVGAGAERFDVEFRIRRHDGVYRWFQTRAIPLRDGAGRIVKWFGSNTDIDDLKETQARLDASAEEWRTTFDSVADGVCLLDGAGRIVRANRAMDQLAGEGAAELVGRLGRVEQLTKRESAEVEWGGRWFELTVDPVAGRGAVCVVRDIGQRKREERERAELQEQLAQSQKMESIGRLAGGVAHDFNNLLTVIMGYAKLALSELEPGDRLAGYVGEIDRAGERAAELTRRLLAFGRKQMLQPRELDLNGVVAGMEVMLRRLMGEDVAVELEACEERPAVYADPHQLEQVIMNLAVNARDAMPRGGRLKIGTAVAGKERRAILTVSDTGHGMDEATRQRIFEPFFTTKGPGEGTGLGLSMVQGIVEQSGGSIEVESERGSGTTFRIYLPALEEVTEKAEEAVEAEAEPGGETILVVEDQEEVLEYACAVLEAFGYRVLRAGGGAEALGVWEREAGRIRMVLSDVVMPGMSGPEMVERLEGRRVAVVFMSGYPDDVLKTHGSGVWPAEAHLIQKPFSPEQLARKVRAVLEGDGGE